MLVNCKILIFLFFKNAAEMFYAWHNPAIRWVNKPIWKKKLKQSNIHQMLLLYNFVKLLCLPSTNFSAFIFHVFCWQLTKISHEEVTKDERRLNRPHCDEAACSRTDEAGRGEGQDWMGQRLGQEKEQEKTKTQKKLQYRIRPLVELLVRITAWEFGVDWLVHGQGFWASQ